MSYLLTDDNAKIYYEEIGEGKTIILIHGWSCNNMFFKKQVAELSRKYKVVTYDLRGHGLSEITDDGYTLERYAKDLKNLIKFLGLKNVTLVGWSMGTHIIFDYIKQFGCNNLDKIAFIDMSTKLITDEKWTLGLYDKFSYEDNLNTLVPMNADWKAFAKVFIPAIFAKSGYRNEEDFKWASDQAAKNSANVLTRMWISMSVQDYRDVLPKITIPALITFGEESCLYSAENSEYMRDKIKDSKLVSFPKCGHALFLEEPEMFNKILMDFVE